MRNLLVYIVFGVLFIVFASINYYIGLRGWQTIGRNLSISAKIYWPIFWLISMSFLVARVTAEYLPRALNQVFIYVGSYWLAFLYYFLIILVLIDLVRLIDRWLKFIPISFKENPMIVGLTLLILVTGVVVYGAWNAYHPRVHPYDVKIAKKAGNLKSLHVVMVSDIHLGTIVNNKRLNKMVDLVNEQKPDIVLFAGDVIDENVQTFAEQQMSKTLRRLKAPYGAYAVLGNHEYIGGHPDEAIKYLQEAGVRVLRDDSVKVADSFYLVGRDDRSAMQHGGTHQRKPLSELMKKVDPSLPIILMDHQPFNLQEPQQQGVDLQLSGHTHAGQLFPDRLITDRMYEVDWGLLQKGNLKVIVSSGYGTWGPPIRLGNYPEIVDLNLSFEKPRLY